MPVGWEDKERLTWAEGMAQIAQEMREEAQDSSDDEDVILQPTNKTIVDNYLENNRTLFGLHQKCRIIPTDKVCNNI